MLELLTIYAISATVIIFYLGRSSARKTKLFEDLQCEMTEAEDTISELEIDLEIARKNDQRDPKTGRFAKRSQ